MPRLSGPYFIGVSGVKIITNTNPPIAIQRNSSRMIAVGKTVASDPLTHISIWPAVVVLISLLQCTLNYPNLDYPAPQLSGFETGPQRGRVLTVDFSSV